MIKITAAAAEQIKKSSSEGNMGSLALRIAAKKDDSGAFEYGMGFDDAVEGDLEIETEGVKLIVSPLHQELVRGMTIDYVEMEPGQFHFIFLNPNDPNFVPPKPEQ